MTGESLCFLDMIGMLHPWNLNYLTCIMTTLVDVEKYINCPQVLLLDELINSQLMTASRGRISFV